MSSQQSDAPPPLPSPSSFDSRYADVILRSSDGTDFRMLKVDLIRSSPVFESMFSLPQPTDAESADEQKDGLPVVALAEPADVLGVVLRCCMPGVHPLLDDLCLAYRVAEAARKYDIEVALQASREVLCRCAQQEPVRVYAVACCLHLEKEARLAARHTLRQPVSAILSCEAEELGHINGHELRRLLNYRESCRDGVLTHFKSYHVWTSGLAQQVRVWERACCGSRVNYVTNVFGHSMPVQSWWEQYMRKTLEKLRESVDDAVVSTEDAFSLFLRGSPCQACQVLAASHMTAFTCKMAREISDQISKVRASLRILV